MEDTRKCGKCHQEKELTPENWKAKFRGGGLQVASNCRACADRDKIAARERRAAKNPDKENTSAEADASAKPDPEDASEFLGVTPITLDEFCGALDAAGNISLFSARVDTSALDLDMEDIKAAADSLADIVWEKTGYRFHYHSTHEFKNSSDCRYEYHCAQLDNRRHKSKKNSDVEKQRDKGQMAMFPCGGWVTIWASPDESDCFVRIRHLDCHQKYVCIDLPGDVKKFIAENPKLRAPQLWKEILKTHPRPNFLQKSVYNHWLKQQQASWRRCDDELESAKILLKEFATDPAHKLELIPMPESERFRAIGFVFPSLLHKWGNVIREAALDSTFKTNKAGFECFALLGEVGGSGVPLGFLLLKSNNPQSNEREEYIRAVIRHITAIWEVNPMQKNLKVAQTAIPTLKIRFNGQTSEVAAPARPKLIIHLNGRTESAPHVSADSDEALERFVDSLDDDEEDLNEDPDAVDIAPAAVPNPLPSSPCTPGRVYGSGGQNDPFMLSSSPVVADEEEDDLAIEFMKKRIIEVQEGLEIMQSQLDHPQDSKLWLRSMKAINIGGDLANMATDVRRFTTTGTVRTTTYAKKGDKPSARYTRNTMGLYIP
ncbi:hypothetical protein DFH08DRAFT_828202 [Mycena albidolilacea]|uniref:Uncharacterized protein n=1 Tax=Mycena albidolilacea TaxID=1033008 RepID=A0AAD6YWW7_9AGAR|nr:hypothetical protein DFH08DRAFT_828202 [Mycena albidolilacea]